MVVTHGKIPRHQFKMDDFQDQERESFLSRQENIWPLTPNSKIHSLIAHTG